MFSSLTALAVGLTCLAGASSAMAQVDDFNDGNDTGWTRYDPGSQLTLLGAPFNVPGNYSLPSGGYRLKGFAFPGMFGAGPVRMGSYRNDVNYSNGRAAVDLASWDQSLKQAFGLLFHAKNLYLGGTEGYTINYNNEVGDFQINLVYAESPTTLGTATFLVDPNTGPYRIEAEGYGSLMVARLLRASDPGNPILSVIANDGTYPDGKSGVFTYDDGPAPDMELGCDVTFDNYAASAPAHYAPIVTELQPRAGSSGAAIPPQMKVSILDRESTVVPESIVLTVDGTAVPFASLTVANEVVQAKPFLTSFAGVTVTYTPATLPNLSGTHTNKVVFRDSLGAYQTNVWTYTFTQVLAANASPLGSGMNPGFNVRMVMAVQTNVLANSLDRALIQLGPNPPAGWVETTTNLVVQTINFTQKDTTFGTDGHFTNDMNFPGIDPLVVPDPSDLAMEIHTFLELPAGAYTLGVSCDDGFRLSTGNGFADANPVVLGEKLSGTFDGTMDFNVSQSGIYPVKMIWFERGGGAAVELWIRDRNNPENSWLVGDPASPVKAWQKVRPQIISAYKTPTSYFCSIRSYTGVSYVLEYKNAITDATWTSLAPVAGNGGTLPLDNTPAVSNTRFYRVRVQ
jgi:hypothetical protein